MTSLRKRISVACGLLCVCALSGGQGLDSDAQDKYDASYRQAIAKAIETGFLDGHIEKYLRLKGDSGAVLVAKIVSDRSLTLSQLQTVLDLVRESFRSPDQIVQKPDLVPSAAMLLVRYVELAAGNDAVLKADIADTRGYLRAASEKRVTGEEPQTP